MKSFLKKLIIYGVVALVTLVASIVLVTYINEKIFGFNPKYFTDATPYLITLVAVGFLLIKDLLGMIDGKSAKKKAKKAVDKVQDSKGKDVQQYYDKDFVTEADLKKEKGFNYHTLASIRSCEKDGVLVRAEDTKTGMEINFVEPIHALVVGTTSSGKTTRFVVPSLQIMSMTASKPSFVITDPKGELYKNCYNKFREEGYDVHVIDLRSPFQSVQWNPLTYPYDMYQRSFNLDKEVKVHQPGDNPKLYNLILQQNFDYTTTMWFEFNGTCYCDKKVLETDMRIIAKDLQDKTFTALNDICTTLAPIESTKDPSWERTAQRLIHAVMLAMLEDSRIPELGMTREKYNLYNVYKICNTTDNGRDSFATLKQYLFEGRNKFSKVPDLASTALKNADTTTKNYMGFVSSKTALFSDTGISFLTACSELEFVNMDERPTAIFLVIPDEIRTRYPLAILFVTQLYKRLVEKAVSIGGRLRRNVYFMLDEFGNMPRFPEFGSIMTVGRSRGIFFELCVQSYSQLYQVYGQDEGKIIKDNCPIQCYIASEDTVTNKEFSELLGKKTIVISSENKSVGPDGKESKSYSKQVQSIPIAYPEELMSFRDKKQVIFKTFSPNAALKTTITPYFESKSKVYNTQFALDTYQPRRLFEEDEVFYDIKHRNSTVIEDEDDDDDDLF